jgi:hypothetical protein
MTTQAFYMLKNDAPLLVLVSSLYIRKVFSKVVLLLIPDNGSCGRNMSHVSEYERAVHSVVATVYIIPFLRVTTGRLQWSVTSWTVKFQGRQFLLHDPWSFLNRLTWPYIRFVAHPCLHITPAGLVTCHFQRLITTMTEKLTQSVCCPVNSHLCYVATLYQ